MSNISEISTDHICPNCANADDTRMVYSAKGTKIICLDCYMSWPKVYSKATYHRAKYRAPKKDAPTYVQLWRENQKLKQDILILKNISRSALDQLKKYK